MTRGLAARLCGAFAATALLLTLSPASGLASTAAHVDVQLTENGPWIAQLVGFDLGSVRSVTYYVRDAKHLWRRADAVTSYPFDAPIKWWEGDNAGFEAVTAHVVLHSGRMLKDPGGWHWVNGEHANPRGAITAWTNVDGTPGASYRPDLHGDDISGVEFWFRDVDGRWHDVGPGAKGDEDADWLLQSFKGIDAGWQRAEAAVSIHVVWPNGKQLVDPTSWATSFQPPATTAVMAAATGASCGDPHAHVYSPDRLQLLAPCVTVTGVIDVIRNEKDGDLHVLLRLDPGQEKYLNGKNAEENGDLVLEPVCMHQPTQADAVSACTGYHNSLPIPPVGAHVSATGPWVLDVDHGWLEIHPVFAFGQPIAPSSPSAAAAPAPPPAAAPQPAADPYAALRAQGISAICKDGTYSYSKTRSGTCSHHGGVAAWTGLI